jgi:lipoxygenase homology domain-containing protein 1
LYFRWLATDEDDGKIVRELKPDSGTKDLDSTTYNVKIKTGDKTHAGTDADVHIKICGDRGDSDRIVLKSSDNTKNKFERGQIDSFSLQFEDLGKVCTWMTI